MLAVRVAPRAEVLRKSALRAIREYRRYVKWANDWDRRYNAGLISEADLDRDGQDTMEELTRLEWAAIDSLQAYATATGQRGPHLFVVDGRGDTHVYLPELLADATAEHESVFTTIRTSAAARPGGRRA